MDMIALATSYLVLLLCTQATGRISAEGVNGDTGSGTGRAVIGLTAFDVNEQTLNLQYKIVNGSDRNIWVLRWYRAEWGTAPDRSRH
jgi:hypothetical protein